MMARTIRGQGALRSAIKATALVLLAGPAAATALALPPALTPVNGSQFFSWFQTTNQTYPVATYPAGATTGTYVGVPFLTDSNAAVVNSYLTSLPAGSIRAVKVENP